MMANCVPVINFVARYNLTVMLTDFPIAWASLRLSWQAIVAEPLARSLFVVCKLPSHTSKVLISIHADPNNSIINLTWLRASNFSPRPLRVQSLDSRVSH